MSDAMSDAAILAEIETVAREHLDHRGELTRETRIVEALRLDSVRLLTLVVEVENRFRIALPEGDEAGIETVGDLVDAIRAQREGHGRDAD